MDELTEAQRREAAQRLFPFAKQVAEQALVNGRVCGAGNVLGLGNVGAVFLCEAGPDVDSPVTIALKLPWKSQSCDEAKGNGHPPGGESFGSWAATAELKASRAARQLGVRTFLLAPEVAAAVIKADAVQDAASGVEKDGENELDLELLLARKFHVNLAQPAVPVVATIQRRWPAQPRFLFALAGNVVTHMAALHRGYLAHSDVKPENFMIADSSACAESNANFRNADVCGAFIDYGGARTGYALKRALEKDEDHAEYAYAARVAQAEDIAMCSGCRVCFSRDEGESSQPENSAGPIMAQAEGVVVSTKYSWNVDKKRWYFSPESCPKCMDAAPPYELCEGMLGVQKGELFMLLHGYGPSELNWEGLFSVAEDIGTAAGATSSMQKELELCRSMFSEWRRLVDTLIAEWELQPRTFDRVAYWRRTGGPAEQLLAVWRAGNEQWPEELEMCTAEVVARAEDAMKAEMDAQMNILLAGRSTRA